MIDKVILNKDVKGELELFYLFEDGTMQTIRKIKNTILYSGADIMAKVLSGNTDYTVNAMYLEYYNGSPSTPTIGRDRDTTYYEGLSAPAGYIRVMTIAEPTFYNTATDYDNNKVQFMAVTDGTYETGPGIIDGTTEFYGAALVAVPDFSDKTEDVLFSAANITDSLGSLAPITKVANAQFGLKWTVQFV